MHKVRVYSDWSGRIEDWNEEFADCDEKARKRIREKTWMKGGNEHKPFLFWIDDEEKGCWNLTDIDDPKPTAQELFSNSFRKWNFRRQILTFNPDGGLDLEEVDSHGQTG